MLSMMYIWHLAQCLKHSRYSINAHRYCVLNLLLITFGNEYYHPILQRGQLRLHRRLHSISANYYSVTTIQNLSGLKEH